MGIKQKYIRHSGGEVQEVMRSPTLLFFFLLPFLSSGSDNRTNRPTKAALRKERRELLKLQQKKGSDSDRESKTNKNCSRQHNKRKFAIWRSSRRKQKRIARKAYRMGILASLAYHNFDTKGDDANTTWGFSLIDDPLPIQYLSEESDSRSSTTTTRRKKRSLVHAILAGTIARLHVETCQIRYKVAQILQSVVSDSKLYKSPNRISYKKQCKHKILKQHGKGKKYIVEWYFSDWHEKNKVKAWHDTDLIIATSGTLRSSCLLRVQPQLLMQ